MAAPKGSIRCASFKSVQHAGKILRDFAARLHIFYANRLK